jgi:hypothetical protein
MGTCCSADQKQDKAYELGHGPSTADGVSNYNTKAVTQREERAVKTIQSHYRGITTRRMIKEQYGFEAKASINNQPQTIT